MGAHSAYVTACYALAAGALLTLVLGTHLDFVRELRRALRRAESRRVIYLRQSHEILAVLAHHHRME